MNHRRSIHQIDPILVLVLSLAAFLLLYRLDHRPLWQDEAETACLAKNVLRYGMPVAFDGKNTVSQEEGREFGDDHVWRWSPWLQIYLAAAGLAVGGNCSAAARMPFAVAALCSVYLVYHLVRYRLNDVNLARLAALLLSLSVPFLMYSRQCRYYSIAGVLALATVLLFLGDWQHKRGPAFMLVILATLLFHTNYLLFFSLAPAFCLSALIVYRATFRWSRLAVIAAATSLCVVAGARLYGLGDQTGMIDLLLVPHRIEQYFASFFQFMLPLPILAFLAVRWLLRYMAGRQVAADRAEEFVLFAVLTMVFSILALSPVPQCYLRYLIHLMPLCAIVLAWTVVRTWQFHKGAGIMLAVLLAVTN